MPVLYSACDFVLAPSEYEGCSLVPLEAMACNVPIITSRTGIFLDGRFERPPEGIEVLKERSVQSIRAAMGRLPDRRDLDLRGFVEANFPPQGFHQSYAALVNEACH
jgi:glycosyltransferase involved in cell wall biosynthesis